MDKELALLVEVLAKTMETLRQQHEVMFQQMIMDKMNLQVAQKAANVRA